MEKNTTNTALLVMDMQSSILSPLSDRKAFTDKVSGTIAKARARNIPVIYVVVGFRPDMPEISENNKRFAASKARLSGCDMDAWSKIDPSVAPLPGEIIVTKRRLSAFTGSDLEVILRAMNIRHLVLTGVATGGVVLSTLCEAADKDFNIKVIADACTDIDPEIHRILTTKIFVRNAEVIQADTW